MSWAAPLAVNCFLLWFQCHCMHSLSLATHLAGIEISSLSVSMMMPRHSLDGRIGKLTILSQDMVGFWMGPGYPRSI
jgi:hypothetical protein